MSMIAVPSTEAGAGSLPAELRLAPGHAYGRSVQNFGRDRLLYGQRTVRRATEQPRRGMLSGMGDMGQCDPASDPFCTDTIQSGLDITNQLPVPSFPTIFSTVPEASSTPTAVSVNPATLTAAGNLLTNTLAVAQGGGYVAGRGGTAVYGSPQASQIGAAVGGAPGTGFVASSLGFGGGSSILLLGVGVLVVMMMSRGK
jgi:hypothetical protein